MDISRARGRLADERTTERATDFTAQLPDTAAVLARAGNENFPVAARVLPSGPRTHLMALYGYFRLVDYAGDEAPGNRDILLDHLEADLGHVYRGTPRIPLLRALAITVHECGLPKDVLTRLIDANRRDQHVHRYCTFAELVDYCALSANPVGESVLHIFGCASPELVALSDRICTALQILEHCQDVLEDHRQGRVYLPEADLHHYGCRLDELESGSAPGHWRAMLRFQVVRARRLLDSGAPLVGLLPLPARLAVAGYVAGGRATARALAAARFDPVSVDATPARTRIAVEWARLLLSGGSW
ncbi:squalene synthase HpnC [Saccharopolyspora gloriosae]|uniref:squalene synthase HpnC n=1 Tax=Saccharopolyspora gloriosae TaxID=455344 RepID=UPI001FB85F6E|nr:squalene synthase HpnC [Saccharopolyspora gloriosae]